MKNGPKKTMAVRLVPIIYEYVQGRAQRSGLTVSDVISEAIAEMMVRDLKGETIDPAVKLSLAIETAHTLLQRVDCAEKKNKKKT